VKAGDLVIIEGDKVYRATGPASFVAVIADPTSHTHATSGIVDNAVNYAKIQDVSAASRLIGRGSGSGAGDPQEISLGSGLSMSGTVLSASGGGGGLGEPLVMPSTVMPALAIDVTKFVNTKSISADSTMTFSNATPTAGTRTELRVTVDSTARTLTIPSSYSYARNSLITTVLIPASSTTSLSFEYTGSRWEVYGDPVLTTGTGNYVLATSPTLVTPILGIGSYTALRTTEVSNVISANAATITLGNGNHQSLTLAAATGAVTVDFILPASASAGTLVLLQDDTARDVTWTASGGGTILWSGTQPTWNTDAASSYRVIAWRYDGTRLFLSPTDVFTANS